MCTETFLRLSEEKRRRVLDAAWEEFTRVSFAEASINRIVQRAEISRGSFYQYFRDKEELMEYLMEQGWQHLTQGYQAVLKSVGGDIFALQECCFDRFCALREQSDPVLERFMAFLRINPGLDSRRILSGHGKSTVPDILWEDIDTSALVRRDRAFVDQVLALCLVSLAAAVADCACNRADEARIREELKLRLEIIRRGSVKNGGSL